MSSLQKLISVQFDGISVFLASCFFSSWQIACPVDANKRPENALNPLSVPSFLSFVSISLVFSRFPFISSRNGHSQPSITHIYAFMAEGEKEYNIRALWRKRKKSLTTIARIQPCYFSLSPTQGYVMATCMKASGERTKKRRKNRTFFFSAQNPRTVCSDDIHWALRSLFSATTMFPLSHALSRSFTACSSFFSLDLQGGIKIAAVDDAMFPTFVRISSGLWPKGLCVYRALERNGQKQVQQFRRLCHYKMKPFCCFSLTLGKYPEKATNIHYGEQIWTHSHLLCVCAPQKEGLVCEPACVWAGRTRETTQQKTKYQPSS